MLYVASYIIVQLNINGCVYNNNIILAAPPAPPQAVTSRVLESDTDYSTVKVTWEPPSNNSRVDFYHVEVVADSEGINYTLYAVETPNTIVVLSIFPYNVNITIFLFATDSCGARSIPAVLSMSYVAIGSGNCMHAPITLHEHCMTNVYRQ